MPREEFDPRDDDPGAPNHNVDRFQGLLFPGREPSDPIDQEFEVGLDRTEIDVLGIPSRHQGVVVWHAIDRARGWLMNSYDEER